MDPLEYALAIGEAPDLTNLPEHLQEVAGHLVKPSLSSASSGSVIIGFPVAAVIPFDEPDGCETAISGNAAIGIGIPEQYPIFASTPASIRQQ